MISVPSGGMVACCRPCSAALFSLKGKAATVASTSAACLASRSPVPRLGALAAALSELRADDCPLTFFLGAVLDPGLREVAMSVPASKGARLKARNKGG